MANVIVKFSEEGAEEVKRQTVAVSDEFEDLTKAIELSKKQLKELGEGSKEFDKLSKEIKAAESFTKSFTKEAKSASQQLGEFEDQAFLLRIEMDKLEKQGLKDTKAYKALSKQFKIATDEAARLEDVIADVKTEIQASASDTAKLDAAIRGLQLGVNVFGALQAGVSLFAGENEQLEKALIKLNGVMLLSNSLQEISAELSRKDSVATKGLAVAKRLYAVATGGATKATKLFKLALISTGIGAFVVALGIVVANFGKIKEAITNVFPGIEKFANKIRNLTFAVTDFFRITNKEKREATKIENDRAKALKAENEKIEAGLALLEETGTKLEVYNARKRLIENQIKLLSLNTKAEEENATEILKLSNDLKILKIRYDESTTAIDLNTSSLSKNTQEVSKAFSAFDELNEKISEAKKDLQELINAGAVDDITLPLAAEIVEAEKQLEKVQSEFDRLIALADYVAPVAVELSSTDGLEKQLKDAIENTDLKTFTLYYFDRILKGKPSPFEQFFNLEGIEFKEIEGIMEGIGAIAKKIQGINTQVTESIVSIAEAGNQRQLNSLQNRLDKGLISEKQYEREVRKLKNEQAKRDKRAAVAQAAINIPIAISNAFSQTKGGLPAQIIASIIAGITATANLAAVIAKPVPKFYKGIIDIPLGNNPKGRDTIPAMLHEGESVMTAKETKEHKPLFTAIRNGKVNDFYQNKAMQIIASNRSFSNNDNKELKEIKMQLAWINTRLKEGNIDRRLGNSDLLAEFKTKKVRT